MSEPGFSAIEAATALQDLRDVRSDSERRAAGLSLMIWALVLTSMAGTIVAYGLAAFRAAENGRDFGPLGWELFMSSLLAMIVFWVVVGTVMQRIVFRSFSLRPRPGDSALKTASLAAAVVVASIVAFGLGQGLTRAVQGIGTTPDQYDELHHNLGTAVALAIAGTVFLAMVIAQRDLGLPRGRAAAAAFSAMALGHVTTFLWFPDMGLSGAVATVLLLPLGLILFGLHLWRQG